MTSDLATLTVRAALEVEQDHATVVRTHDVAAPPIAMHYTERQANKQLGLLPLKLGQAHVQPVSTGLLKRGGLLDPLGQAYERCQWWQLEVGRGGRR